MMLLDRETEPGYGLAGKEKPPCLDEVSGVAGLMNAEGGSGPYREDARGGKSAALLYLGATAGSREKYKGKKKSL